MEIPTRPIVLSRCFELLHVTPFAQTKPRQMSMKPSLEHSVIQPRQGQETAMGFRDRLETMSTTKSLLDCHRPTSQPRPRLSRPRVTTLSRKFTTIESQTTPSVSKSQRLKRSEVVTCTQTYSARHIRAVFPLSYSQNLGPGVHEIAIVSTCKFGIRRPCVPRPPTEKQESQAKRVLRSDDDVA